MIFSTLQILQNARTSCSQLYHIQSYSYTLYPSYLHSNTTTLPHPNNVRSCQTLEFLLNFINCYNDQATNFFSEPINTNTTTTMSDSTFHMTKEDVRKPESKASQSNSGNVPAASDAAQAQSIVDSNTQSKADLINERVAGLPKPEAPPVKSDFNTNDPSAVNVGSGSISGTTSQTGPETAESSVRVDGNATKTNTAPHGGAREDQVGGIPNDAVARGSKDKAGLVDTTN
jgi:hypothetical protein